MKQSEMYPSPWLHSDDIPDDETLQLTVKDVESETMKNQRTQKDEKKFILQFRGDAKPMILNKSNGKVMFEHYADDSDDWIGQTITVGKTWGDNFGEPGYRLCILPPAKKAKANGSSNGAPLSPMAELRAYVAAETGGPEPAPAQILQVLKKMRFDKNAPTAGDVAECKTLLSDYLAANGYAMPALDQPKPGQMDNSTMPARPVAPPAADADDSDPFADE